ncbi:hypothetical protein ACF3DV_29825 [Chlorogloeopsis fritschii PCC 9212]|uniref:Uncharacterized protein n=1 Tax=Chlorogloeopsis fritschii PCC 6912 TaxID=211165 RepID=A0A433NK28_CHLFR|nr:hypothetical protein [Chlorogloeopsis fritschii]RUR83039.1 hypothetical protein PCC6912_24130 [Chlorogloeopsis fritschii PCC 6912]
MDIQLTAHEIDLTRDILQDYEPAQHALDELERHNGDVENTFQDLWIEKHGLMAMPERKSFWEVTLKVLRKELCGDDGFRGQVSEYTKNPGSAPLLTGLIVSLVGIAGANGIPIDPAIATVIVLYILKISLNIFCEYTEPPTNNSGTLPPEN